MAASRGLMKVGERVDKKAALMVDSTESSVVEKKVEKKVAMKAVMRA